MSESFFGGDASQCQLSKPKLLSEVDDDERLWPFMDIHDAPLPSHSDHPQVFPGSTKVTFRPSGGIRYGYFFLEKRIFHSFLWSVPIEIIEIIELFRCLSRKKIIQNVERFQVLSRPPKTIKQYIWFLIFWYFWYDLIIMTSIILAWLVW